MRAVAYVRVSSSRQVEEGVSLEAQEAAIRAWCEREGHDLAAVYRDEGVSAWDGSARPGFDAAVADVKEAGSVLVVYSLSRLSRRVPEYLATIANILAAGGKVHSLSESIGDPDDPEAEFLIGLYGLLAQRESRLISFRTRAAFAQKRRNGKAVSARPPYGWRKARDGTLIEEPYEQHVIQRIRDLRAEGLGWRVVADRLWIEGLPTRAGTWWNTGTLSKIMRRADRAEPGS